MKRWNYGMSLPFLVIGVTACGFLIWQAPNRGIIIAAILAGSVLGLSINTLRLFSGNSSRIATTALESQIQLINASIIKLSDSLFRMQSMAIVSHDARDRCIYDRHVDKEVSSCLHAIPDGQPVTIDIIGLSLNRFYHDQWQELARRGNVRVRAIVQHPSQHAIEIIVNQEGRNLEAVQEDILKLTKNCMRMSQVRLDAGDIPASEIEVRWFPGFATITMTRINDLIFVRPRFLNEGRDWPFFFEKYSRREELNFRAYEEYFEHAWQQSIVPSSDDYDDD
jgi:hypothetical protein